MTYARFIEWSNLPVGSEDLLRGWTLREHREGGDTAALAIMLGTEIHCAVNPLWRHRLMQRARIRTMLKPLLDIHGFLTTRVWLPNPLAVRFVERLGFEETWLNGRVCHFMLCDLPYGRAAKEF